MQKQTTACCNKVGLIFIEWIAPSGCNFFRRWTKRGTVSNSTFSLSYPTLFPKIWENLRLINSRKLFFLEVILSYNFNLHLPQLFHASYGSMDYITTLIILSAVLQIVSPGDIFSAPSHLKIRKNWVKN